MSASETLQFNPANGHLVEETGASFLLHVPTTALFGLEPLGVELLKACNGVAKSEGDLVAQLASHYEPARIRALIAQLRQMEVLQPSTALRPINPAAVAVQTTPLSTIVLNVNTGCNLHCTYCYKEDLAIPRDGRRMDFVTAARSVDLLFNAGAERDRLNIVFFGGEPLTNLPLIKDVVAYSETLAHQLRKRIDFSLTTNATLLDDEVVDWLDAHRFGVSVSMDGPEALHDRHRKTVGGQGTYGVVARKVRRLLDRYRSRPVGARVTLGHGNTDVEAIHRHLRDELGFHEVGYAPVTSADDAEHVLTSDELAAVHTAFERLGEEYRRAALENRNNGFSNMHQLMTDLHEGRRKSVPCGAGIGMLAVDADGGLNLCHRFTGSDLPTFGNLGTGIDQPRLAQFVSQAIDREGTHCETCRIRNLCAGGCYHESYARFGDPQHRTYHYCGMLRRWVDFGVRVYADIQRHNPQFFERHLEPRSAP